MKDLKQITQLNNAVLNIAEIIENTYHKIVYSEFSEENIKVNELRDNLSKFCTLVEDFKLFNKLDSNVEYSDLFKSPKVYLDYT